MSTTKKNDFWKDWSLGCAIQIGLFLLLCAILDSEHLSSVLAYAFLLSIPSVLLRLFLRKGGVEKPWLFRLLGPGLFGLALLFAFVAPMDLSSEEEEEIEEAPMEEKQKMPDVRDFSNPPPGVRCTPPDTNKVATLEQAIAQLDELIGLQPVKEEVRKFANYVHVAKQREAAGLKVASLTYHMVFSGNPGTGKTTVARIMADIYRTLGIVSCGHLVECDRGGLIGEYVGQTAVKTSAVIDYALDGVLFIDEAYSIVDGKNGGYGAECIATLLKRMEDDRSRLVVIVAGYTDEMKIFVDANPGLKSRINRQIDFPDYSAEELAAIFRMNAQKNNYTLSPEADAQLVQIIAQATANRDRQFGNARWARNLLDDTIVRQATRLSSVDNPTREQLMTLLPEDITPPQP